jgi:DnaK suppressor protein
MAFNRPSAALDRLFWPAHNDVLCAATSVHPPELNIMLKKTELLEFKAALLELQARIRGDVQRLTREALDRNDGGGDSKSPTHIAELGTQTFEQDFSLRVAESDQDVLAEIEAALKRIEAGTFGACAACLEEGKPPSKALIPKARLKAIPYAKNCVECERKRENLSP